ncbi:hypothetical protein PTMSG1_03913 [Pyrenophora teres f. maculata]|nr:hypothetical protein PTMSG1_03913 [Pyrenophora teres f. maculata]
MPRDPTGVPHTGTLGLFDDPDELAASTALATSHELHRLKGQIRRLERHDVSAARRQYREGSKERRKDGKKDKGKEGWWCKIFNSSNKAARPNSSLSKSNLSSENMTTANTLRSNYGPEDEEEYKNNKHKIIHYEIVRRPTTPEAEWKAEDVQSVDSIWLQECGMVRVKSGCPGGCRIVSERGVIGYGEEDGRAG